MELKSEPLDSLLKGGVEHGVITNFYGTSGTGKTNICVQAAASCIQEGGRALFIDTEGGFSTERFVQIYGDEEGLENLVLTEPTTFEEQKELFKKLEEKTDQENIDLVIVDSLVSLYRIELQEEVPETNRELSKQLSVLSKIARKKDLPIIVTNQVYSSFETDEVKMVGKDVPTYWSKCLVKLETKKHSIRKAVLKKHRSRPEGIHERFVIKDKGIFKPDKKREEEIL